LRFIDRVDVVVSPGNGGDGASSFRREKHVPLGGPDGGDGGSGGAVTFRATTSRNTLQDYWTGNVYRADAGEKGGGNRRSGLSGDDLELLVPVGTLVIDQETGEVLRDLAEDGATLVFAGGRGGLGNTHFKSATNQAPTKIINGEVRPEVAVRLELKLLADVGLVGFPNAGKSTLISRVSAARPKIGSYPFTTLSPQLGVVRVGPGQSFVVADIPGLIEGAAEGHGLGHRFLRHVERCRVLLHLVSGEDWQGGVAERYAVLREELVAYDENLAAVPTLPVLTKTDLLSTEQQEQMVAELTEAAGQQAVAISAVSGDGLGALMGTVWRALLAMGAVHEDEG